MGRPNKPTSQNAKIGSSPRQIAREESFLLEIGTEELPSAVLPESLTSLAQLGEQFFRDNRLGVRSLRTMGTSRRLALLVDGLELQQPPLTQEIFGPPQNAAFDSAGQPTKAALGFAKAQGVSIDRLIIKETSKGLYVAVEKHQRGQSAKRVIINGLPALLEKMHFPRAMKWNNSGCKFARPIRWMVVLLGDQPLKVEIGGIQSGDLTRGHRFFRVERGKKGQTACLIHARDYVKQLRGLGVVVNPEERRLMVVDQIGKLAKSTKGEVAPLFREELIEEAVWGVEFPHALLGSFKEEFLSLPDSVLLSSMKEHQGFFSVVGQDGELLPKFIAVTNMPWGNTRLIRKGNERVLAARLNDAQYFFAEDAKRPLSERVSDLEGMLFHHKLGTVHQKVNRIHEVVQWMAQSIDRPDLKEICGRAALLSKTDLTTGMVGEFPTLQGVMGEVYAGINGERPEVCRAIGTHYFPRFPEDHLPDSLPGMILSCADRCDSLVAFFSVGMVPSGSEDPLGLRRAAYGLVRILTETPLRLNLVQVMEYLVELLSREGGIKGQPETVTEAVNFVLDRLRFLGRHTLELRDDVMEAVIRIRPLQECQLGDLLARMQALQGMITQPDFEALLIGFKRAHRIVDKEGWTQSKVAVEHFQEESEHQLFLTLERVRDEVMQRLAQGDYQVGIRWLLDFKKPIDTFFDSVMVNDPDPRIRENRLSLLSSIRGLFFTIADFSCLESPTD